MSVSLRKPNHAFIACESFLPCMNELSLDFRHRNNKWTLFRTEPSVILLHTDSLNSRTLCKVINGIKLWGFSSTIPVKRSYCFYPVEHVREWCKRQKRGLPLRPFSSPQPVLLNREDCGWVKTFMSADHQGTPYTFCSFKKLKFFLFSYNMCTPFNTMLRLNEHSVHALEKEAMDTDVVELFWNSFNC